MESTPLQESQGMDSRLPDADLFEKFNSYPFNTDREFAKGLAIILGHADTPASKDEIDREDDLVLQAKCFYFSRKEKLLSPLDFRSYKAWRESTSPTGWSSSTKETSSTELPEEASLSTATVPPDTASANQESLPVQEPAYPSSFARIVELITTGQPIPGIQHIPDTVLAGHDTPSEKPRRRKPWEKEDESSQT